MKPINYSALFQINVLLSLLALSLFLKDYNNQFLSLIIFIYLSYNTYYFYQLAIIENQNIKEDIKNSKMILLGEMIENVIHQWRQPLNNITTNATGVIMQQEYIIKIIYNNF